MIQRINLQLRRACGADLDRWLLGAAQAALPLAFTALMLWAHHAG